MSFVGKPFEHDLFVSYSHGQTDPSGESPWKAWVQWLAAQITTEVQNGHPEFRDFRLFIDPQLDPTMHLSDQLRSNAENAAAFLLIMNPWLLESSWCKQELGWFRHQVDQRQGAEGCVFVVQAQDTAGLDWPDCLHDANGHRLLGFPFTAPKTDRPLGWLTLQTSPEFVEALLSLTTRIIQRLRRLKDQARLASEVTLQGQADLLRTIYLHARSSESELWHHAKAELGQQFTILPETLRAEASTLTEARQQRRERFEDYKEANALLIIEPDNRQALEADVQSIGFDDRSDVESFTERRFPCAVLERKDVDQALLQGLDIDKLPMISGVWPNLLEPWFSAKLSVPVPRIRMSQSAVANIVRPYPGLRPFDKHEWPIFFGREKMVDDVIGLLDSNHLVTVHGSSGCGKSSLIRAGVLARLERDSARFGTAWRTAIMRPGSSPLWNLAVAIAELVAEDTAPTTTDIQSVRRLLNYGKDALAAIDQQLCLSKSGSNVCLLLDQFEELFRYVDEIGPEEAATLVEVLQVLGTNEAPAHLYAILTMRSDHLGDCAQFVGFAELINRSQYLLPRPDRRALMRAITGTRAPA